MRTLSLRAYARHRAALGLPGRSLAAVQRAIDSGRIVPDRDGRIDPTVADRQWLENTIPRDDGPAVPVPPDPALPLLRAYDELLDLATTIEERLSDAFHATFADPATRKPESPAANSWKTLYADWAKLVPALEALQHEARAAVPAIRAAS